MTSGACMPQEAMKKGYIKIWYDGVVTTLNLQHVAEQFRRMGLCHMARLCLPLISFFIFPSSSSFFLSLFKNPAYFCSHFTLNATQILPNSHKFYQFLS